MKPQEKGDWEAFKKHEMSKMPKKPEESQLDKALKAHNQAHQMNLVGKPKKEKK